jgi:hypothetical protein
VISRRAIQWRVRYRRKSGRIAFTLTPRPSSGPARLKRRCRKEGEVSWITNGRVRLAVDAPGRWSAVDEQQVDTPLNEPPLAGMRSSKSDVVARGRFYSIERRCKPVLIAYGGAGLSQQ